MVRYKRSGTGSRRTLRRYVRPWVLVRVAFVDEVSVAKLRKAMARRTVRPLLGGLGDLSLVLRTHRRGETLMVLHLVIDRKLHRVKHYGILGLKGWNPTEPSLIEFRAGKRVFEFDLLKGTWRRKR